MEETTSSEDDSCRASNLRSIVCQSVCRRDEMTEKFVKFRYQNVSAVLNIYTTSDQGRFCNSGPFLEV